LSPEGRKKKSQQRRRKENFSYHKTEMGERGEKKKEISLTNEGGGGKSSSLKKKKMVAPDVEAVTCRRTIRGEEKDGSVARDTEERKKEVEKKKLAAIFSPVEKRRKISYQKVRRL